MSRLVRKLAALTAAAALAAPGIAAGDRRGGTNAGVYSVEQAEAGRRVYMIRCAMCHGADLLGTVETPGLTGKFVANWGRKPLSELFGYIARAMPQQAPGSLAPDDTASIVAFVLQVNGAPAGAKALPADFAALQRINLEPPRY